MTAVRRNFFTQQNIENWNGRGKNVVEAKKTGTFKKRLDKEDTERKIARELVFIHTTKPDRLIL